MWTVLFLSATFSMQWNVIGVGDAGNVDGFTVPISVCMEHEEVGDEGNVDGFTVLRDYVTADFLTGFTVYPGF